MTSAGIRLFESLGPGLLPTAEMAFYENNAKKTFIANFMFGEQLCRKCMLLIQII